jgi:uncharacterized protein
MKNQKSVRSEWIKRVLFYVLGLFILAFAVSISKKSTLGVSPVSSVANSISLAFDIDLGVTTALVFCVYVLVEVILLGKEFKIIQILQVPCAVMFGYFVSFTGSLIASWVPETYIEQFSMILLSTVMVAVGFKLYLHANLIPQAGDGLVNVLVEKTGKSQALVKNVFDICSVVLAIVVSLIFTGKIQGVREGTVIAALGVGRVLALLNKLDNGRIQKFIYGEKK